MIIKLFQSVLTLLLTPHFMNHELLDGKIPGDLARKRYYGVELATAKSENQMGYPSTHYHSRRRRTLFAPLPLALTQLIPIGYPNFPKIAELDLKWYRFPALSRLGFDIGGVQYTAPPFGNRKSRSRRYFSS